MSDGKLRARFEALRAEDERAAPSFAQTVAAARARAEDADAPGRRWLWAPVLAAAAIALVLLLARPEPPPPSAWSPDRWAMPTDVLLELPGAELLRDAPSIGVPRSPSDLPPRTSDPRRPLT